MHPTPKMLSLLRFCDSGCIEWTGFRKPDGYGQISHKRKFYLVHRIFYESQVGPISKGLVLDHLCRNPACVNTDHLEAVSHKENCLRGLGVGAVNSKKTHCPKGHEFSKENTYFDQRRNARHCRSCMRERDRLPSRLSRYKNQRTGS